MHRHAGASRLKIEPRVQVAWVGPAARYRCPDAVAFASVVPIPPNAESVMPDAVVPPIANGIGMPAVGPLQEQRRSGRVRTSGL